ncbi:MAG TPA: DUF4395 family protein, partial [Microbacterium sp.]|nr:DUF4395 family protein [Microbacterium sp.]
MTSPAGIDPRGPRFAATITAVLLLIATFLGLIGTSPVAASVALPARVIDPAFLLTLVIALLFLWSVAWPQTAPWGALFRSAIRPRLSPPSE